MKSDVIVAENSKKEFADSIPSSREVISSVQQTKAGSRAKKIEKQEIKTVNAQTDLAHTFD